MEYDELQRFSVGSCHCLLFLCFATDGAGFVKWILPLQCQGWPVFNLRQEAARVLVGFILCPHTSLFGYGIGPVRHRALPFPQSILPVWFWGSCFSLCDFFCYFQNSLFCTLINNCSSGQSCDGNVHKDALWQRKLAAFAVWWLRSHSAT